MIRSQEEWDLMIARREASRLIERVYLLAFAAISIVTIIWASRAAPAHRAAVDMTDSGIYAWHTNTYGIYGHCAIVESSRGE